MARGRSGRALELCREEGEPALGVDAMDATTRQVIAFHVEGRSQDSAEQLWAGIPAVYREQATFYTDHYADYKSVILPAQHRVISELARQSNHVERFNCWLYGRLWSAQV